MFYKSSRLWRFKCKYNANEHLEHISTSSHCELVKRRKHNMYMKDILCTRVASTLASKGGKLAVKQQNNSRSIFVIQIHVPLDQTVEELKIRDQNVNKFVCILTIPQQETRYHNSNYLSEQIHKRLWLKKDKIFASLDVLFHVYFSSEVSW